VLDALIRKANDWVLFSRLRVQSVKYHTLLYADDFIMFISPTSTDLELCQTIFQMFEEASGLGLVRHPWKTFTADFILGRE
jgi:hypothetical protein